MTCLTPSSAHWKTNAYTWPLTAADWRGTFTRSAAGYAGATQSRTCRRLPTPRPPASFLMERVAAFVKKAAGAPAAALTKQLYLFLQSLGAEDALNRLAAALRDRGRLPDADEVLREWNVVMGLLDQLARLLGMSLCPRGLRRAVHAAAAHDGYGTHTAEP